MDWLTRGARAATLPKCTRCTQAAIFAACSYVDRACKNDMTGFGGKQAPCSEVES